jgi:hypothetical protein
VAKITIVDKEVNMVAHGRVQNGVVVLDKGVHLPEGQEVTVLVSVTLGDEPRKPHSILDIPPVRVGAVLRPLTADDDLLGEMLEDRT